MKYIENISLTTQLRYGLLLMAVVCVLGAGTVPIFLSFRENVRLLKSVQQERSRAAAEEINAYLGDLQRKLGYLARVRGLSEFPLEIQRNFLEGLARHNTAYGIVAIADNSGRIVSAVSPYDHAFQENQSNSQAFRRAFKEHEEFFSPVEFHHTSQMPLMTMAVPIRNRQDEIDGALLARVNLEYLWFVVSSTKVGESGYAYLVDERRFLMAQKDDFPETSDLEDLSEHPLIQQFSIRNASPVAVYSGLQGVRVLGAGARIESMNWYAVVELPLSEAYAPVRKMLLFMVGALCLAVLAALGLGFFFSGQFVSPLRKLTVASEQIRHGDFNVRVHIQGRHELGVLASAFNTMTTRVQELISGLERNVAELQRKGAELQESEERYRLIAEHANVLICEMSLEGKFLYVNPAYKPILGYETAELLERGPGGLTHPEEAQLAEEKFAQLLQTKEPSLDVWRFRHKNGEWRWFTCIGNTFVNAKGETRIVVIASDISESKHAEQERERLIEELETKNAELERFTYTVSHDLKSPLVTIKGFLGMLEQDARSGETEQLQQDIHYISTAADQMFQLLDDLLELSRIGRVVNPSEEVCLREVLDDALNSVAGRLSEAGVRVDVSANLPTVRGDYIRLRELFENLLDNAAKFMGDQDEPTIEIGVRNEAGTAVFSVKDNGMGIEAQYREKVFGLFERLNPSVEGTGIGLSIVKRIVELHDGRIWVESQGEGTGTTFYFTLGESTER